MKNICPANNLLRSNTVMQFKANAYAKINLTLDVLGKRADGYHEIESVMQTVDLYDTLTVTAEKSDGGRINIFCDKQDQLCREEENICYRACNEFLTVNGITGYTVDIEISKRIPIAAGLGGGSSDGAETLKALNSIFSVGATAEMLQSMAARVGADVPFFIRGGTQLAGGIGDILTPIPAPNIGCMVVAKPALSLFSGNVYSLFDSLSPELTEPVMSPDFLTAADGGRPVAPYTNNMLFRAVSAQPGAEAIEALRRFLLDCGADCANMTGSGPTVYGIFSDYARACVTAEMIRKEIPGTEFCRVCNIHNVN